MFKRLMPGIAVCETALTEALKLLQDGDVLYTWIVDHKDFIEAHKVVEKMIRAETRAFSNPKHKIVGPYGLRSLNIIPASTDYKWILISRFDIVISDY